MFLSILPKLPFVFPRGDYYGCGAVLEGRKRRNVGWLTAGGLLRSDAYQSALFARPERTHSVFGGMLRFDWLGFFFKMLFMFAAAATALLLMDHEKAGDRGEAYLLLLAFALGMDLMAASADLVMLYRNNETTSIPLYVLAGFIVADDPFTEAGLKYMLFRGHDVSGHGLRIRLLFGLAGTTDLYQIAALVSAEPNNSILIRQDIFRAP